MKTQTITQELILNTHAGYCNRQWCEKRQDIPQPQQPLSPVEQLKNICWDGLLPEILPEICLKENNKPLVLWELMGMTHTLHLKLGGINDELEPEYALHPYIIMEQAHLN